MDNLNNNRDMLYEFPAAGRLLYAKAGTSAGATGVTANWTQTYTYDRYGNKSATSVSGDLEDTTRALRDGLSSVSVNTATNRVNTSGWEYDLAGNLIRGKDGTAFQRYEYDAAGRLVKIKNDSNVVLETYGASRERLMTETSSLRRYYAWGGQNVVAEYTETSITYSSTIASSCPTPPDDMHQFDAARTAPTRAYGYLMVFQERKAVRLPAENRNIPRLTPCIPAFIRRI